VGHDELAKTGMNISIALLNTQNPLLVCVVGCFPCISTKFCFEAQFSILKWWSKNLQFQVRAFWPRYWGGIVVVDEKREFFKALGGGRLNEENVYTGIILNATARANWKRARATGIDNNSNGEATIKGGLYIIRAGNGGIAYQFVERNFGDWAPLEEVLKVCEEIQQ
jgi:hypothetical protein